MLRNDTPWRVQEEAFTFAGSRVGRLSCAPGLEVECKLQPERGFLGVEKGVDCRARLSCGGQSFLVALDFPAVGADSFCVEGASPLVLSTIRRDGRSKDGAHVLRLTFSGNRVALTAQKAAELDGLALDGVVLRAAMQPETEGPLGLPFPADMAEATVEIAANSWAGTKQAWLAGPDQTTEYVCFALRLAHKSPRFKRVALRLLGRVGQLGAQRVLIAGCSMQIGYQAFAQHLWPAVPAFERITAAAQALSDELQPELGAYCKAHRLREALGTVHIDAAEKLTQRGYAAFLDERFEPLITEQYAPGKSYSYELGVANIFLVVCRMLRVACCVPHVACCVLHVACCVLHVACCMLHVAVQVVCHYLQPLFDVQTRFLAPGARHRLAPPKTADRINTKIHYDYRDMPRPRPMHTKDPLRKSICSETAEDQLCVWEEIREHFKVLQVKNSFRLPPEEVKAAGGMMQILINILFEPTKETAAAPGAPAARLTFGDILRDERGLQDAIRAATSASVGAEWEHQYEKAVELLRQMAPALADEPVALIAELQLHLEFFVKQRKKTHLWFKVLRSKNLKELGWDCRSHIDSVL